MANRKKFYTVEIKCALGCLSYTVFRTEKGAMSVGRRIANEAFYGEESVITVTEEPEFAEA